MNVQLPDSLEEITIAALMPGETVYAVPWAMYADTEGNLWVNGKFGFRTEPAGTAQMELVRIRGGLSVNLSRIDETLKHGYSKDGESFVGGSDPIAVVELTGFE